MSFSQSFASGESMLEESPKQDASQSSAAGDLPLRDLQRCNRELISLMALPAMWYGKPPSNVARILADVLGSMLSAELAYVALRAPTGVRLSEAACSVTDRTISSRVHEIGRLIDVSDGPQSASGAVEIRNPLRAGNLVLQRTPIGVHGEGGYIAVASINADFPTTIDRLLLRTAANQAAIGLQSALLLQSREQLVAQLKGLAEAAASLAAFGPPERVLEEITARARELIGAHQAVTSLTTNSDWAQAINAVSLSDKYAQFRAYDVRPSGSGIYSLVCMRNRPMRMSQAELESHHAWRGFGKEAARHPPVRGWLAAPLMARDGGNIGVIQLSDKYEGDFTEEDESILVQFAHIGSSVIENTRLYEQLRDADQRKDAFLATLSHELRNPLAPIRNAVKLLRTPNLAATDAERARAMIDRQSRHMSLLLEDLLDVSRITRGALELRKQRLDLAAVIDAAAEAAQPLIHARAHTLSIDLPETPVHLEADELRLAQIMANLLTNAAKYTDTGGQISLQVRTMDAQVILRVSDNGIGISPEMLPRVFEMFSQVRSTLDRSEGGLGIGLALVRGLVALHGGTIQAKSAGLGKGSEFVVRLPLGAHVLREPTPPPPDEHREQVSAPLRVLIADDNQDSAESLQMLLSLDGHDVRTTSDGQAAVEAIAAFRPHVALLDIGMPKLNGYQVAERIRAQPGGEHILLIAVTGWGQEQDKLRAISAGFDRHLTKPIDPAVLEALLAETRTVAESREGSSA